MPVEVVDILVALSWNKVAAPLLKNCAKFSPAEVRKTPPPFVVFKTKLPVPDSFM
jgi:hypothetical protein